LLVVEEVEYIKIIHQELAEPVEVAVQELLQVQELTPLVVEEEVPIGQDRLQRTLVVMVVPVS